MHMTHYCLQIEILAPDYYITKSQFRYSDSTKSVQATFEHKPKQLKVAIAWLYHSNILINIETIKLFIYSINTNIKSSLKNCRFVEFWVK